MGREFHAAVELVVRFLAEIRSEADGGGKNGLTGLYSRMVSALAETFPEAMKPPFPPCAQAKEGPLAALVFNRFSLC